MISAIGVAPRPLAQPLDRGGVDAGGGDEDAERLARGGVEGERLAERAADRRAGFLGDQGRGGDVPLEAPAQGGDEIGLAGGDEGDAQRDRIGLGHRDQVAVDLGQLVRRHPRAGERGRAG